MDLDYSLWLISYSSESYFVIIGTILCIEEWQSISGDHMWMIAKENLFLRKNAT